MSNSNLIDVTLSINRIKMDNEWYLRIGPHCWYMEIECYFEQIFYTDTLLLEETYQLRKKQLNELN